MSNEHVLHPIEVRQHIHEGGHFLEIHFSEQHDDPVHAIYVSKVGDTPAKISLVGNLDGGQYTKTTTNAAFDLYWDPNLWVDDGTHLSCMSEEDVSEASIMFEEKVANTAVSRMIAFDMTQVVYDLLQDFCDGSAVDGILADWTMTLDGPWEVFKETKK